MLSDPCSIDIASQPVDSTAPLSCFAKNGYYMVQNNVFRNKLFALQQASRLRLGVKDVKWVFNDSVYEAQDWKKPVAVPLSQLYRMRAQQLRDRYDYLVLSFSGGGDSTNVLHSFLLNNIHLDEIIVGWPRGQTAGKYVASLSSDSNNFLSEWDYLIEPKLKWVQTKFPRTKITIVDPYDNLNPHEPNEDIGITTTYFNLIGYMRYKAIDRELLDRQQKHKKCAMIMGINPPNLAKVNRHVFAYFSDMGPSMYASDRTSQDLERNIEYFYWTPDMPEIPIAQSHALLDQLRLNSQLTDLILEWDMQSLSWVGDAKSKRELTRRWVKKVLYPTYDSDSLQVNKTLNLVTNPEWFSWFYKNPHSVEIAQPHLSAMKSLTNMIDPCFFVNFNIGNSLDAYVPFRSKFYYIGDLDAVL